MALVVPAANGQTTYHVSLKGSDSSPGTPSAPFRTLGKALSEAMLGGHSDVVIRMEAGLFAASGVDVAASFTRPGIADGASLIIEGGHNARFDAQVGQTQFAPPGVTAAGTALSLTIGAREQVEISRLAVAGSRGTGLRVTSNPSGPDPSDQAAASVLIRDSSFSRNGVGVSVSMPIGPDGGADASTHFTMTNSEIENNGQAGLMVNALTDLDILESIIRDNGTSSGVGLEIAAGELRTGLIEDTQIIGNRMGMSLANVGLQATAVDPGLRLSRVTLADNSEASLVDNVRRLRFALESNGHNPVTIVDRTITVEGSMSIEDLEMVPQGELIVGHYINFENVRGSGLVYSVTDTDTIPGPEIRVTLGSSEARVELHGTPGDDVILSRTIGGHHAVEVMTQADPTTIATRLRIVRGTVPAETIPMGNMEVHGGAGDDTITAQATFLPLYFDGGSGSDTLAFEDHASHPLESVAPVHLFGGAGEDTLAATTRAGLERVTMEGGPGNNHATGGDGNELIIWRFGHGPYLTLNGGAGTDTMRFIHGASLNDPIVIQRNPVSPTLLTVNGGVTYTLGQPHNINQVEVHTVSIPNAVETGHLPTWLESLRIVANGLPLQATVQAFEPTTPGGTYQSIWVMGADGFEADSSLVIHGIEGADSRFDTQPLGFDGTDYTPGWVAVRTGDSGPLNVYSENMKTITMFGHGGEDLFVPQFWPTTTQILEGGPDIDRILMATNQQPYTAAMDGPYTVLTRENFASIRYNSIEIEDINPTTPPAILGDVTGDGVVNVADVTMLAHHLNGSGALVAPDNADVNEDSVVDQEDLAELISIVVDS